MEDNHKVSIAINAHYARPRSSLRAASISASAAARTRRMLKSVHWTPVSSFSVRSGRGSGLSSLPLWLAAGVQKEPSSRLRG